jgi:hypothetical protein
VATVAVAAEVVPTFHQLEQLQAAQILVAVAVAASAVEPMVRLEVQE